MFLRGIRILLGCLMLLQGMTGCAKAADSLEGAAWRVTPSGVEAAGIRALSGADGITTFTTRVGSRCLTTQARTNPASLYLYFDGDDRRGEKAGFCRQDHR